MTTCSIVCHFRFSKVNFTKMLHTTVLYCTKLVARPYLLRRASAIAYHHTPKIVLRSAIFSTPELGKIIHS